MASLAKDGPGRWRVLLCNCDGKRPTVRLGRMSHRQADAACRHIEALQRAKDSGVPIEAETAVWLDHVGSKLRDRIARVGLVAPLKVATLGEWIERWMERRGIKLAAGTVTRLNQSKRSLVEFFKADKTIATVTEGDAEDFRSHLLAEGLAEATVRKRCSDARVWYRYAVRHGLIKSNPFEAVPTTAIATAHLRYISEADALKVLAEIRNPDLRLVFVLARWGGLRTVSEPKAMTWDAIDWEKKRVRIASPKTARHAGHESRMIPLFPELVEPLQSAFDRAAEGELHVLPVLHRVTPTALRKPLRAAIKRAGLPYWPRLWHNLRSSRQTDLAELYPSHVVCEWMGNSEKIAQGHYLQVLNGHYERAATAPKKPAQNPAQQVHAASGNEPQPVPATIADHSDLPSDSEVRDSLPEVAGRSNDPDGIRTRVTRMKTWCPRPG